MKRKISHLHLNIFQQSTSPKISKALTNKLSFLFIYLFISPFNVENGTEITASKLEFHFFENCGRKKKATNKSLLIKFLGKYLNLNTKFNVSVVYINI